MVLAKNEAARFALNVRGALWQRGVPRPAWARTLADLAGMDEEQARQVLAGAAHPSMAALDRLARALGQDLPLLVDGDLLLDEQGNPHPWILLENVRFLVRNYPGLQKELAADLGVDVTTVSHWMNRPQLPQQANARKLATLLGVPASYLLDQDPLFLYDLFISDQERRNWLIKRIRLLPPDQLDRFFPALQRLLAEG